MGVHMNMIRRVIYGAAKERIALEQQSAEAQILRNKLANSEDFYLRVRPVGYDWGPNNDPDNLLPTKNGKA